MISGHLIYEFKKEFFKVFPEMEDIEKTFPDEKERNDKLKQFIIDGIPFGTDRTYFNLYKLISHYDLHTLAFGEPVGGYHPMQCLDCAAEHIAKAIVNLDEILKGYDGKIFKNKIDHIPLMIGNIAEAEAQTARIHDYLSQKIRALKLRLRDSRLKSLKDSKQELNKLFWALTARKRGVDIKRIEQQTKDPKNNCGCGKEKQ